MSSCRVSNTTGLALVVTIAGAAWTWRDCVLLAAGVVLAYRFFLMRMDRGAPWPALTAAVDALSAGVLAAGAGIALMAGMAAAWLGWWQPATAHAEASMALAVAASVVCCLARANPAQAAEELRLWLGLLGGAGLAIHAQVSGVSLAPCLFAATVGMAMLWAGWKLATQTASALLRADSASPNNPPSVSKEFS